MNRIITRIPLNDRPTSQELLEAVEQFLKESCIPALAGPLQYQARVAANVVAIVAKEMLCEDDHLAGEWQRLGSLLESGEAAPAGREALREAITTRTATLVEKIRSGDADSGPWRAELVAHLRQTVTDKLEVSQPRRK